MGLIIGGNLEFIRMGLVGIGTLQRPPDVSGASAVPCVAALASQTVLLAKLRWQRHSLLC